MHRQAVGFRLLWQALQDYDLWPIYLLGLTWLIPQQLAVAYLTLILRGLKFDTFETNLLTVPAYVLFILQLVFWTWISEKINNRYLIILMCQIYMLPILVGLETLPAGPSHVWSRYVLNFLLVGFPYVHAIIGERPPHPFLMTQQLIRNSGHDKPQRRLSSHARGRVRAVQYVRPGLQRDFIQRKSLQSPATEQPPTSPPPSIKIQEPPPPAPPLKATPKQPDLPRPRQTPIPHRQQSPPRAGRLQHRPHRRLQALLPSPQRAPRQDLGRHVRAGTSPLLGHHHR